MKVKVRFRVRVRLRVRAGFLGYIRFWIMRGVCHVDVFDMRQHQIAYSCNVQREKRVRVKG